MKLPLLAVFCLAGFGCSLTTSAKDLADATEQKARVDQQEFENRQKVAAETAENQRLREALELYQDDLEAAEARLATLGEEASAERDAATKAVALALQKASLAEAELEESNLKTTFLFEDRERILLESGRAQGRAEFAEEQLNRNGGEIVVVQR